MRISRPPTVLVFILLLSAPIALTAQSDSLELEREIQRHQGGPTFVESARSLLTRRLREGDSVVTRKLITFMDRRRDTGPWLSPRERLIALTALPALDVVLDSGAVNRQLAHDAVAEAPTTKDDLTASLRALLRARLDVIAVALDESGATERERTFTSLLINHLLVRGLRARLALNDSVDAFVARHPGSWQAHTAAVYVKRPYREDPFGMAFHAGYALGGFTGGLDGSFGRAHGAVLSVEAYLERATLTASILLGVAEVDRPFTARGSLWGSGTAPLVAGLLAAGYELRYGLLGFTPLAGLTATSLTQPAAEAGSPGTGLHIGLAAGAIAGYRIPFDVGTHVDLRLRFVWSSTGFSNYDPALSGSLWHMDLGFALIRRDYAG